MMVCGALCVSVCVIVRKIFIQKLMKARKAAADDGAGKEAGLVREWGKKQTPTNDDTVVN